MKKHLLILAALLLLVSLTQAADSTDEDLPKHEQAGCPAHRAAQMGLTAFHDFHEIMAPVWHNAYPDEDYEALLAAAPKFKAAFAAIAKMKSTFKTEGRKSVFLEARANFSKIVESYATAAEKGDKETVYDLMPQLHNAFEMTASTLLPLSYPELEAVTVTLKLIIETHLPQNNADSIVASTDTLLVRFDSLSDTTAIPDELKEKQTDILVEFASMKKLAVLMKESCGKNDMKRYNEHAKELEARLKGFFEKYI